LGNQLPLSLVGEDSYLHFWQHRFYDFNVWSDKKKIEKLEYMHQNPVKRGLVQDPKDWPWSSCGFYAGGGDGLVKIDLMSGPTLFEFQVKRKMKSRTAPLQTKGCGTLTPL
jgi:hypothetical protein